MLDVIAGDIPREGHAAFDVKELFAIWETQSNRDVHEPNIPHDESGIESNAVESKARKKRLKRKYGFREPPRMRLGSVSDFLVMFFVGILFPLGVPLGMHLESKRKSLRWRYGALIGATVCAACIFFFVPFSMSVLPTLLSDVPFPTISDGLFLFIALFVIDVFAIGLLVALVVLYFKRNDGGMCAPTITRIIFVSQ